MSKIVNWGDDPEEGMVLIGLSYPVVLDGRELKEKMITAIKRGQIGIREAINILIKEGHADFDNSKDIVEKMKQELSGKRGGGPNKILRTDYYYNISKMFWAYEEDIPKNDIRYSKLDLVDLNTINEARYLKPDKSFDLEKFISDHTSLKRKKEIKTQRGYIEHDFTEEEN